MTVRPYLAFAGNCREAFTRYQEIFGGELAVMTMADAPPEAAMPGAAADVVMHAALTWDDELLMGADDPTGSFDGPVRGMCVSCSLPDTAAARKIFDALSEGGVTQMPLDATFFSPAFGMCVDRFGTPWMVTVDTPASP